MLNGTNTFSSKKNQFIYNLLQKYYKIDFKTVLFWTSRRFQTRLVYFKYKFNLRKHLLPRFLRSCRSSEPASAWRVPFAIRQICQLPSRASNAFRVAPTGAYCFSLTVFLCSVILVYLTKLYVNSFVFVIFWMKVIKKYMFIYPSFFNSYWIF